MPEITESELKKQIEKQNFCNLYLLHGEEKYLLKKYADKLIQKASGGSFLDFNFQKLDGAAASVDEIAAAVEALPFMAERKCVAVSNLNVDAKNAQDIKKLNELIDTVPETTVLVIYLPSIEIDYKKSSKWKNFIASVNKKGASVCFKTRSDADLEKLLCNMAAKRFCTLSRQDAAHLIFLCGKDLSTLTNEMEKLCSYTGEGEITRKTIELVAVKNMETTVFMLAKALVAGEYDKAYQLLDLLFYQNEEPVAILSVLSSSYLDMYRVKTAVQSGRSALEPGACFEYRGKEFRLRNAERDAKKLSTEMLRESLNVLLETDIALKSSRTSSRIMMEELIAKLLLIAEREKIT